MANSNSAKKRIRQNIKARALNRSHTAAVRTQVKSTAKAIDTGEATAEDLAKTYKAIDQLAAKGRVHKNQAARRKSRLTKKFNDMPAK